MRRGPAGVRSVGPAALLSAFVLATASPVAAASDPAVEPGTADATVPPAASAAWLVGLVGPGGVVVDPALGVVDVDATLDLLLGLVASGSGGEAVGTVAEALADGSSDHTGASIDATFVSATAKLVIALDAAGLDPRDVGGTDLVAALAGRVGADGRATDRSALGDLTTPRSQALTVLALVRTAAEPAVVARAADALVDAACPDGGLPAEFGADPCTADLGTTAFAAAALAAAAAADGAVAGLATARDAALTVLMRPGAADTDALAAGLTATALRAAGRSAEADAITSSLTARFDGCAGGATGALLPSDDPLRATVGALLAASGSTLTDLTVSTDGGTPAPLDCTPGEAVRSDSTPTGGTDVTPDAVDDATSGTSSRRTAVAGATALLALALLAGIPVLRRSRRADARATTARDRG